MDKHVHKLYLLAKKNKDLELQFTILKKQVELAKANTANIDELQEICQKLGLDELVKTIDKFMVEKDRIEVQRQRLF